MYKEQSYINFTKLLLLVVFLVILAGSIVRTTQSGMGCPDWPTCFGNMIPPTERYQVEFQQNHPYKKGQFIIYNDSLKYAKEAFTSTATYNAADWQQYEKHNYAKFNLSQTWIEYINRLTTGVLGILMLIHVVWTYRSYFKTNRAIFWLSFSFLILTAIEAWMGKVVVDTNLAVVKVTAHMLLSLLIALIAVVIIHRLENKDKVLNPALKWITTATIIIVLAQIILGTEVREQVDEIAKSFNYTQRENWVNRLNSYFDIHKATAWLVAILAIIVFWLSLSYRPLQKNGVAIFITVLLTMSMGLILAGFDMPSFAQPVHLLLAAVLFIQLFALRLRLK